MTTTFPSEILSCDRFAFDTETTGLHYPEDRAFGFSIALPSGFSAYYDIREQPEALSWFRDVLAKYLGRIIGFNVGFDVRMMAPLGVQFPLEQLDDAAIRATLLDEHRTTIFPWTRRRLTYTLDSLCETYLGERKVDEIYDELAKLFGGLATRNVQMPRLKDAPSSLVGPYAIRDAELTLALYDYQTKEIDAQGIHQVCEFERNTIPHVIRQELAGVRVDIGAAEEAMGKLSLEIELSQSRLEREVGGPFNVNSTPQIRNYYNPKYVEGTNTWVLADGTPCGTTPKGNPSINNAVLQSIKDRDPVAAGIIEIRSLIRTRDTFLAKHICGHEYNGRVYPTINQVASENGGTKTGRFSYVDPALQQIPNRNKTVAAIVKPCFLPDEGEVWVDGDLNSFEVRVFAHLVGAFNPALVETYANDPYTDFHQWVADLMDVPRNPRPDGGANAKQLNLSMIFNAGNGSIADQLGLPCSPDSFIDDFGKRVNYFKAGPEAMGVINAYHRQVQGVKKLAEEAQRRAERRGWIQTMYGRRLRFPRKFKSYKASGILIQSTSADINKENWGLIHEAMDGRGRLMLNTHDSYSMSIPEDKVEAVWKDVKGTVERDILRVPLILDLNGQGRTWWEAIC